MVVHRPILEKDQESGDLLRNALTKAVAADDICATLRFKKGGALGDQFLEEFALSVADGSIEQRIAMAVFDDRECGNRATAVANWAFLRQIMMPA